MSTAPCLFGQYGVRTAAQSSVAAALIERVWLDGGCFARGFRGRVDPIVMPRLLFGDKGNIG
jgi:hypothetical protein